jgi:N,N'-diacetyllegionaminate synthase
MKSILINSINVGPDYPPFIIAEVGINHNGEIEKAFSMINIAKKAGASAVKFQTFKAEEFVSDPNQTFTYKSQGKKITESMLDMFKRYEFSRDEWFRIKKKCDQAKMMFLSSPQNQSDLDLLLELGVGAIKVGSDDFTNLPLLAGYVKTKLPIILSCGMSDLAEVYQALETVGSYDGYPTILLLCTSQYPTPPEDVNLLKLKTLANTFPMITLGFSDHTQGSLASSLALSMGACVFEKHFTLDHNLPGPDHWFSEDPLGLSQWIESINKAYAMLGKPIIRPTKSEKDMRILARRSVVTLKDISAGEKLTNENIGLKRPGNGLAPSFLNQVLGLKSTKNLKKGLLLKLGDMEE